MTGVFEVEEKNIAAYFTSKYGKEVAVFDQLLEVYSAFLKATSGNIKDNKYPEWTILILLSQTLPLMNNALKLLVAGYLRSSEIMVRVASEAMILSCYFKEFPEAEIEYRSTNYRDFFRTHKIDDMLKKVEKEGLIFIKGKAEAKNVKWNKMVFLNLFKESSRFLHNNPDLIYDMTLANVGNASSSTTLILGPQLYKDTSLSIGMRRLFNTLLISLVVLGVSLSITPDENERVIIEMSKKIVDELNHGDA